MNSPWLANKDWQTSTISSNSKVAVYGIWAFTVIWNLVSIYLPFAIYKELLQKQNYAALIGLLFPFIGIVMLIKAIKITTQYKKFGAAQVTLDPFPGSIGGHVGGTIELPGSYALSTQFIVTLSSIHGYLRRRNDDDDREENIKWQDKVIAHTEAGAYGTRLIFRFDVPQGETASDAVKPTSNYHLWRLNITADIHGTDVDLSYEIPVYPTNQKSTYISQSAIDQSQQLTLQTEKEAARGRIIVRQGVYGQEMFYPAGRHLDSAFIGLLVAAASAGSGYFITVHEDTIFGAVFFIGVPIGLAFIYMAVNSLTIRNDGRGGIETIRRVFGIPVKRKYIFVNEITGVDKVTNFSSTSGNKKTRYFTVYARTQDGKRTTLGEDFQDEGEADAAIVFIKENLGIK